jgi:hypothetical protein
VNRVYTELSRGETLDGAMRIARGALHEGGQADWPTAYSAATARSRS